MKKQAELRQSAKRNFPSARFFSMLLALSMMTAIVPVTTFAVENKTNAVPINVEIEAKVTDKTAELTLAKSGLDGIINKKTDNLIMNSSIAKINLNNEALAALSKATNDIITISITELDNKDILAEQKSIIGNAPMYNFTITDGNKKISEFANGSIAITLPYALKDGENEKYIAIWYFDTIGKLIPIDATYTNGYVSFTASHFTNYAIGYLPFNDIEKGWYYESSVYAYTNNIFRGVGDNTFAPNAPMTRAMLISTLYKMNGNTPNSTGIWYFDAVNWATAQGISDGKNPEQKINRAELVTILYRYAKFIGKAPIGSWAVRLTYADTAKIPSWAIEGAMYAQMKSILTGQPNNLFDPDGLSTRAEASIILQRFNRLV